MIIYGNVHFSYRNSTNQEIMLIIKDKNYFAVLLLKPM